MSLWGGLCCSSNVWGICLITFYGYCQSPYFIFALFALLTSLLVKYSHSHPPYSLCNLHSLAAFICSAQCHHAHPLLTFCFPFTNSRIPQGQEVNRCIREDSDYSLLAVQTVRNVTKNSLFSPNFLLTLITYGSLSYSVRLHCANLHTPLPFSFLSLWLSEHEDEASRSILCYPK